LEEPNCQIVDAGDYKSQRKVKEAYICPRVFKILAVRYSIGKFDVFWALGFHSTQNIAIHLLIAVHRHVSYGKCRIKALKGLVRPIVMV
jgi:hypothetical protein